MGIISFLTGRAKDTKNKSRPTQPSHSYQSVYDENGYGNLETTTGHMTMIPWSLTQRIDISLARSSGMVCFDFMAEFHRDSLEFSFEKSGEFLHMMERTLKGFNPEEAKKAIVNLSSDGVASIIYRSPCYPSDVVG